MKTLLGHLLLILAIAFTPGCGDNEEILVIPKATKVTATKVHKTSISLFAEFDRVALTGDFTGYVSTPIQVEGRVWHIVHWDYEKIMILSLDDNYLVRCELSEGTRFPQVQPHPQTRKRIEGRIDFLGTEMLRLYNCRIIK